MSTFPFVQVEGSIALPRVRPLERLPATFGREWMLVPPHFSLRAEIRALYAALMRTVCLSAEAFRAASRWDMQHLFIPDVSSARVAASAAAAARLPRAATTAPPRVDATHSDGPSNVAQPFAARRKLAGGACAIGGAAVLAWIVASHAPPTGQKPTPTASAPANREAGFDHSQRLADQRAAHESDATAVTGAVTAVQSRNSEQVVAPALPAHVAASPAPNDTSKSSPLPNYAQSGASRATLPDTASSTGNKHAETAQKTRKTVRGDTSSERIRSGQHAAHRFDPERIAAPVTTNRTRGAHSEASSFSPALPNASQDDDYASIVTYANTHLAPPPASRASLPADSTEWVNHVTQRRVTEVPDSFEK